MLDSPLNIPPALADALDESTLPNDTPGLLAELSSRANEVESMISDGRLAQVWLPAMGAKTVALVLDGRTNSLPLALRSRVDAAVKQIIVAVWALDHYSDLGIREKLSATYLDLASAVADLQAAYTSP